MTWVDDSTSGEWDLWPYRDEVFNRCVKHINQRNKVRIGFIVDELGLKASTSDYIEFVCMLEETGKYHSRYIIHDGHSDFIVSKVPKKSWKERYWWLIAIITLLIGFFMDVFKDKIKQGYKQPKLKEERVKSQPKFDIPQKK